MRENTDALLTDHGVNDPVARKILAGLAVENGLAPPADASIVRPLPHVHDTQTDSYTRHLSS